METSNFFNPEELKALIEWYSGMQDYQLSQEIMDIINGIMKLQNEKKPHAETLKREHILLEREVSLNPKVVKLTNEIEQVKESIQSKSEDLESAKQKDKELLLQRLRDDEENEIAKIRLKYERKRQELDDNVAKMNTNPQRSLDCLVSKLKNLETKLETEKQMNEKALEQRMSKAAVVAAAIVKEKEQGILKLQAKQQIVQKVLDKKLEIQRRKEYRY